MASRIFYSPLGGLEVDIVELYGKFAVGASGAVGTTSGKGIASVTRESAGLYTVTLSDSYNMLLWGSAAILDTADSNPTTVGVIARIKAEAVNASKTATFQFYAMDDGAAADPASGSVVYIALKLRNSSVS